MSLFKWKLLLKTLIVFLVSFYNCKSHRVYRCRKGLLGQEKFHVFFFWHFLNTYTKYKTIGRVLAWLKNKWFFHYKAWHGLVYKSSLKMTRSLDDVTKSELAKVSKTLKSPRISRRFAQVQDLKLVFTRPYLARILVARADLPHPPGPTRASFMISFCIRIVILGL